MTRGLNVALLSICALAFNGRAVSHHSYGATYVLSETIEIRGEIAVLMFRNPHSILQVMITTKDGKTARWACEWDGVLRLAQRGINRFTLKPGDTVVISGAPTRNLDEHRLLVKTIERPADGWRWSGVVE